MPENVSIVVAAIAANLCDDKLPGVGQPFHVEGPNRKSFDLCTVQTGLGAWIGKCVLSTAPMH